MKKLVKIMVVAMFTMVAACNVGPADYDELQNELVFEKVFAKRTIFWAYVGNNIIRLAPNPFCQTHFQPTNSGPYEYLGGIVHSTDESIRCGAAKNPNREWSDERLLMCDLSERVRLCLAHDPETTPGTLTLMAYDHSEEVRQAVADNHNVVGVTLRYLADTGSGEVRAKVARNPKIPSLVQEQLSTNEDLSVRYNLSRNESTESSVLQILAVDSEHNVRYAVANHANTLPETLSMLADTSQDDWELCSALSNENMPIALLQDYIDDSKFGGCVSKNKAAPIEILLAAAYSSYPSTRAGAASNPSIPMNAWEDLSQDSEWFVRRNAAINLNGNPDTLYELSNDDNFMVQTAVARNPISPETALINLSNTDNRYILEALAENPSSTDEILLSILGNQTDVDYLVGKNVKTSGAFTEILLSDHDYAKYGMSENPISNSIIFEYLLDAPNEIRRNVVIHPNTNESILIHLYEDEDTVVRSYVALRTTDIYWVNYYLLNDTEDDVRLFGAANSMFIHP